MSQRPPPYYKVLRYTSKILATHSETISTKKGVAHPNVRASTSIGLGRFTVSHTQLHGPTETVGPGLPDTSEGTLQTPR